MTRRFNFNDDLGNTISFQVISKNKIMVTSTDRRNCKIIKIEIETNLFLDGILKFVKEINDEIYLTHDIEEE